MVQREGHVEQRPAAGQAMPRVSRFIAGATAFDSGRSRAAAARKRSPSTDSRTDVLEKRFRAPVQFIAVQAQDIIGLRLKASERVFLHGLKARRKLFQAL
jgi:hypothetical protein